MLLHDDRPEHVGSPPTRRRRRSPMYQDLVSTRLVAGTAEPVPGKSPDRAQVPVNLRYLVPDHRDIVAVTVRDPGR